MERTGFEDWIAEELGQIETCIDALIASSGARIRTGDEFTSVARGLAVKAAERREA